MNAEPAPNSLPKCKHCGQPITVARISSDGAVWIHLLGIYPCEKSQRERMGL